MDSRTLLVRTGTGITSALLTAVVIIELLDADFSAIVGLPVGLLVGAVVSVALWIRGDELSSGARRAVAAYAAFGVGIIVLIGLRYVHVEVFSHSKSSLAAASLLPWSCMLTCFSTTGRSHNGLTQCHTPVQGASAPDAANITAGSGATAGPPLPPTAGGAGRGA